MQQIEEVVGGASNEFEEHARTRKAFKLAVVAVELKAELTTQAGREWVVAVAGVHPPSPATWARVESLLSDWGAMLEKVWKDREGRRDRVTPRRPMSLPPMTAECLHPGCGAEFDMPTDRRGRPPEYCEAHRTREAQWTRSNLRRRVSQQEQKGAAKVEMIATAEVGAS